MIVTHRELIDFILAQPDERPVDMDDTLYSDSCGCVMVHYGREKLGFRKFACGDSNWYDTVSLNTIAVLEDKTIWSLFNSLPYAMTKSKKNYGDLKRILIT